MSDSAAHQLTPESFKFLASCLDGDEHETVDKKTAGQSVQSLSPTPGIRRFLEESFGDSDDDCPPKRLCFESKQPEHALAFYMHNCDMIQNSNRQRQTYTHISI